MVIKFFQNNANLNFCQIARPTSSSATPKKKCSKQSKGKYSKKFISGLELLGEKDDNELAPEKFRSDLDMTGRKDVNETETKLGKKKLRPKSYHLALRESLFINFEMNTGSYSYWNYKHSDVEKRNTYIEENNLVLLDSELIDQRSVNSI